MWILLSIVLHLFISIALLTAWASQKRTWSQQLTLCRSLQAEALQAIASEGLVQGPYVAGRAGFEPANVRSKGIVSTNVPLSPTSIWFLRALEEKAVTYETWQ